MLKPLQDRIVIRRAKAVETTRGGIIIPENAKEAQVEGEVLAVGPGRRLESGARAPIDVVVGQRVLFGKYAGTEVSVEGEKYVVLREDDIQGILETPAAK